MLFKYGGKVRTRKEYTQREVVAIAALASNLTQAEVAKILSMSLSGFQRWLAQSRERLTPFIDWLGSALGENRDTIKREAVEDLMTELKSLDTLALDALVRALTGKDLRLAYEASRELRDRRMGTPKHTMQFQGEVGHVVTHTIDPKVLEAFERDVLRDAGIETAVMIEGEVVEDAPK